MNVDSQLKIKYENKKCFFLSTTLLAISDQVGKRKNFVHTRVPVHRISAKSETNVIRVLACQFVTPDRPVLLFYGVVAFNTWKNMR